jgi:FkbM family methyltransferase
LRRGNRLAIDALGRVASSVVNSRLPLYRPLAMLGQAERVGTATVRGVTLRLLIDDYCDYAVLKRWASVEPATLDWIDSLPPGASLLDVGANVGRFALYAAMRHRGRIHVAAVDPDLRVAHRLAKSITLNGLEGAISNVIVAASDRDGHERMMFDYGVQQGHLGAQAASGQATYSYAIQTMRIDSMVTQGVIAPPSDIKIDVDGHEVPVLEGAHETLRAPSMRSVLIEVGASTGGRCDDLLVAAGYSLRSVENVSGGTENRLYQRRA